MTRLCQILVTLIAVECFCGTNGIPLFEGISIKRAFDISFKPFSLKPITFIKEKWSPFGIFGVKHSIEKRQIKEEDLEVTTPQLPPLPNATPIPGTQLAPEQIAVLKEELSKTPIEETLEAMSSGIFPVILEPPLSSNFVVIPTTKEEKPTKGLYTDISRALPMHHYLSLVERPAFPAVAPVVENELPPPPPTTTVAPKEEPAIPDPILQNNTIIKGSKLALYFSNVFLQMFSQFLANARLTFSQFSEPPAPASNEKAK